MQRRRKLGSLIRGPESLESRQMLSGHGFGAFSRLVSWGESAQAHTASYISVGFTGALGAAHDAVLAAMASRCHGGDSPGAKLQAPISDAATGATGTITYQTRVAHGATESKLKVNVTGAAVNSTLDVKVGDVVVGQVRTNDCGNGSLVLSSDAEDAQQPAPDFPKDIVAGVAVSAGSLTGTLDSIALPSHPLRGLTLSASLKNEQTGASATVTYKTSPGNGETVFSTVVSGAEADSALDIKLGDVSVGQVTTDASGSGSLVLSSNPQGNEKPLPDNFPVTVAADATVSVGEMSGALGQKDGSCDHRSHATGARLTARLRDAAGDAIGAASYRVATYDGATVTRLAVHVTGAAADSTLAVSIDGTEVGRAHTDSSGAGTLVLSSIPTGNQQPLPVNFPTDLQPGATVSVGSLSGSFAATPGRGGFRFWRR